jgi:hypothetical protein
MSASILAEAITIEMLRDLVGSTRTPYTRKRQRWIFHGDPSHRFRSYSSVQVTEHHLPVQSMCQAVLSPQQGGQTPQIQHRGQQQQQRAPVASQYLSLNHYLQFYERPRSRVAIAQVALPVSALRAPAVCGRCLKQLELDEAAYWTRSSSSPREMQGLAWHVLQVSHKPALTKLSTLCSAGDMQAGLKVQEKAPPRWKEEKAELEHKALDQLVVLAE